MPDSLTNGDANRCPVSHTLNRFQKYDTGKLLKKTERSLRNSDRPTFMGGFGRNRLSRRGNFHSTGGLVSCSIRGLVPLQRQLCALLCRSVAPIHPRATAMGQHAGTGRGQPSAGPRRAPDLLRRDHARSPASQPGSAPKGAEEA